MKRKKVLCMHAATLVTTALSMQEQCLVQEYAPQPGLTDLCKLPKTQMQSLSDFTQLLGLADIASVAQNDSHICRNQEHPSSQRGVPSR